MCHCFSELKPPTSNFGAGVDNSTSLKNIAHSVSIFENLMCQIRNLGIEGCLRMITTQASLIPANSLDTNFCSEHFLMKFPLNYFLLCHFEEFPLNWFKSPKLNSIYTVL